MTFIGNIATPPGAKPPVVRPAAPQRRSWQPRIYGITHPDSGKGIAAVCDLITHCHARGARSIGLEMPPSLWNAPRSTNYFKRLGLHAQTLGMKVMPLMDDDPWNTLEAFELAKYFISEEGVIARDELPQEIDRYEALIPSVQFYERRDAHRAPEASLAGKSKQLIEHVRRLTMLKNFLDGVSYDIDALADRWSQLFDGDMTAGLRRAIATRRPDLAIIGLGHAELAAPLSGYPASDISHLSAPANDADTTSMSSIPSYAHLSTTYSPHAAELFLRHITPMVTNITGSNDEHVIASVVGRALGAQPGLFQLVMRAHFHQGERECMRMLVLGHDAAYLKMSVAEARQKIDKALRKADRRRRIREWLWPS